MSTPKLQTPNSKVQKDEVRFWSLEFGVWSFQYHRRMALPDVTPALLPQQSIAKI
jgi:hypothetical protein